MENHVKHSHAQGKRQSNRNKVVQIILQKDGTQKKIFHEKHVPNGDYKTFWKELNQSPRPNSKRQKKLRETQIGV